jgi:uncharacterized membrane protein YGL010W
VTRSTEKSLISPRLALRFADYASHHRTIGNQRSHLVGITLIVISLLGLLGRLPLGENGITGSEYLRLDAGTLLAGIGMIWYFFLDWKISFPFSLMILGAYFLGRAIPVPANWAIFVLGWVFQGIGHMIYEKNSPAFFKNLEHLLVGPLWLFAKTIGYR